MEASVNVNCVYVMTCYWSASQLAPPLCPASSRQIELCSAALRAFVPHLSFLCVSTHTYVFSIRVVRYDFNVQYALCKCIITVVCLDFEQIILNLWYL